MDRFSSPGRASKEDRTGPILLLALLVAAFIPSLLQEFDLSSLLHVLEEAAGRSAIPIQSLLPAHQPPAALLPLAESAGRLLCSASWTGREQPHPALLASRELPQGSPPTPFSWPPGPATSPRGPPLPA